MRILPAHPKCSTQARALATYAMGFIASIQSGTSQPDSFITLANVRSMGWDDVRYNHTNSKYSKSLSQSGYHLLHVECFRQARGGSNAANSKCSV